MEQAACSSIKDSMIEYFRSMTDVIQLDQECVVTLPLNTFDDRWVDISVKERSPGYFIVDDSGRAWDELFVQGVSLTDVLASRLAAIAKRFGIHFEKRRFTVGCKLEFLQTSIWTVGQCSSLAMSELIGHKPAVEEDPKRTVGGIITDWGHSRGFQVKPDYVVRGINTPHTFDFIARDDRHGIAVNVLAPTSGGFGRAERYGYQWYDLEKQPESRWKKMAILTRPDSWSQDARNLVNKFADKVIDFTSPKNAREPIIDSLEELRVA